MVFFYFLCFGLVIAFTTKASDGGRPVGVVFRGHHEGPRWKRDGEAMNERGGELGPGNLSYDTNGKGGRQRQPD
jgi:hypothetical protein